MPRSGVAPRYGRLRRPKQEASCGSRDMKIGPEKVEPSNPIFELNRHATLFVASHRDPLGPLDPLGFAELPKRLPFGSRYVELSKRHPSGCRMPSFQRGFLSDSLWESPFKIGIANRPEAGT